MKKNEGFGLNETGRIIQELRVKAGFTQKTLAEALHITDKAVSKWERGICLPDVTRLPKLSLLLDTDVEVLISKSIENENWVGLIDIHGCNFAQMVYDKPLVYYIFCYFFSWESAIDLMSLYTIVFSDGV